MAHPTGCSEEQREASLTRLQAAAVEPGREEFSLLHLDHLVGAGDEGDEERQHHVDEQGDEGVEVGPAEVPHQAVLVFELREGGEHVVAVQQREQTLGHAVQLLELERSEVVEKHGGSLKEKKCNHELSASSLMQ